MIVLMVFVFVKDEWSSLDSGLLVINRGQIVEL